MPYATALPSRLCPSPHMFGPRIQSTGPNLQHRVCQSFWPIPSQLELVRVDANPLTEIAWTPRWHELAICSSLEEYWWLTWSCAVCECADRCDILVLVGCEQVVQAIMTDLHEEVLAGIQKSATLVRHYNMATKVNRQGASCEEEPCSTGLEKSPLRTASLGSGRDS